MAISLARPPAGGVPAETSALGWLADRVRWAALWIRPGALGGKTRRTKRRWAHPA